MTDAHTASGLSVPGLSTGGMPPRAIALATVLHLLAAVGVWWMWQTPVRLPRNALPVDVTVEQQRPAAPDLPAMDPAGSVAAASPISVPALDPPSEAQPKAPVSLEQLVPPPLEAPSPPREFMTPGPARVPLSAQPVPTPPAPAPSSQQPRARVPPPSIVSGQPPHAVPHGDTPSPSPFLAAEQARNRARVADNYLWDIARKLAGYRYKAANESIGSGITVVRLVIARDGRLLDAEVAQSSGYPALDAGVVAGARAGSPYAALPPEIPGSSVAFTLPVASVSGGR